MFRVTARRPGRKSRVRKGGDEVAGDQSRDVMVILGEVTWVFTTV